MTIKKSIKTKEGLPKEAFAIIGNLEDPDTWQLPHHKRSIFRAIRGKFDIEKTVDWDRMSVMVMTLLPGAYRIRRIAASPEEILAAAGHLAGHYRKAGKPLPDILAALV
jgi:hypothetical protein